MISGFDPVTIRAKIDSAAERVGRVWPLYSDVGANPLSGFEDRPFPEAVAEAERLFGESEYDPGEFDLTFKVTTNYPWHVDAATILQQYFQQAGLSVEVQRLQWSDWLSQVWINQDFTLSMVNFFTFWEPAYMYTSLWSTDGSFNFRGYSREE